MGALVGTRIFLLLVARAPTGRYPVQNDDTDQDWKTKGGQYLESELRREEPERAPEMAPEGNDCLLSALQVRKHNHSTSPFIVIEAARLEMVAARDIARPMTVRHARARISAPTLGSVSPDPMRSTGVRMPRVGRMLKDSIDEEIRLGHGEMEVMQQVRLTAEVVEEEGCQVDLPHVDRISRVHLKRQERPERLTLRSRSTHTPASMMKRETPITHWPSCRSSIRLESSCQSGSMFVVYDGK